MSEDHPAVRITLSVTADMTPEQVAAYAAGNGLSVGYVVADLMFSRDIADEVTGALSGGYWLGEFTTVKVSRPEVTVDGEALCPECGLTDGNPVCAECYDRLDGDEEG